MREGLSISDFGTRALKFSRAFDQPLLPLCLFLPCRGPVGQAINCLPRQVGSPYREFAAYPSSRRGRQRLLQKKSDGFGASLCTVCTPPQIDLLPCGFRQPEGRHGLAIGAVTARAFARNRG